MIVLISKNTLYWYDEINPNQDKINSNKIMTWKLPHIFKNIDIEKTCFLVGLPMQNLSCKIRHISCIGWKTLTLLMKCVSKSFEDMSGEKSKDNKKNNKIKLVKEWVN